MIPNNPNISTPGPKGRWMECVAAGEILNVKSMKKMKSLGVQHMSFERGDKVGALYPYSKFEFAGCLAVKRVCYRSMVDEMM